MLIEYKLIFFKRDILMWWSAKQFFRCVPRRVWHTGTSKTCVGRRRDNAAHCTINKCWCCRASDICCGI